MGAAFLITLREGLEAALIVSILLAYLKQLGRLELSRDIWWGVGAAILVSMVAGGIIFGVGAEFEGAAEEIFEGVISLVAAAVLTWMIFWMRNQSTRIKADLQGRVESALVGGGLALASLAFVVVVREGIETALFLFAATQATSEGGSGGGGELIGGLLGLGLAIMLGYLVYQGGVRLNLRLFFRITGAMLLVVAAGLVAYGVHELQEAGLFAVLTAHAYDVKSFLPDDAGIGAILRAIFGYQDAPSVLETIAWASYLAVAGFLFFRTPKREPAPQPETAPADTV